LPICSLCAGSFPSSTCEANDSYSSPTLRGPPENVFLLSLPKQFRRT
jgi:hypothetical protein